MRWIQAQVEDGQVWPSFLLAQNGVDVGDAGTATIAILWVMRYSQMACRRSDLARVHNVPAEGLRPGDTKGLLSCFHERQVHRIMVLGQDVVDRDPQLVYEPHNLVKRPSVSARFLPLPDVILERPERDATIDIRASPEDPAPRVLYEAVSCNRRVSLPKDLSGCTLFLLPFE